jgi:hypothetical protein
MAKFRLKKVEPLEKDIQNAVCEYLALRGHFFYRQNNTPIFQRDGKGGGFFRAMPKYAIKGVPDILLIRDGGYVCYLEIKRPSGKLSDDQMEFQKRSRLAGAEYHVIKSVDQLIEINL